MQRQRLLDERQREHIIGDPRDRILREGRFRENLGKLAHGGRRCGELRLQGALAILQSDWKRKKLAFKKS